MIKCDIDNLNVDNGDLHLINTVGSNDAGCWLAESLIGQKDSINWNQIEGMCLSCKAFYRSEANKIGF